MTETFVVLQTQLYELQPDHHIPSKRGKLPSQNGPSKNLQPEVIKLVQRLERLKADILFDRLEAEQRWSEKRDQLMKDAAERRRLQLVSESRSIPDRSTTQDIASRTTDQVNLGSNDAREESDVEALGEFFSGLPDADTCDDSARASSGTRTEPMPGRSVVVRSFGKWNGVNPRRTLEEACKGRSDI